MFNYGSFYRSLASLKGGSRKAKKPIKIKWIKNWLIQKYITKYHTEIGYMSIVLVGALSVGRIKTSWQSKSIKSNKILKETYKKVQFSKNEEFGYFKAGSTIILLFEPKQVEWRRDISLNQEIEVGQAIGKFYSK